MTPRASPNFHTMPFSTLDITWIALAFALTLGLTPLVGRLARRSGMMARPRSDRWHKKPTALLGGVAIFLAVNIFALLAIPWQPQTLTILGASGFLFLVGLADDILHLKPYQKLVGQVMGAAFVIFNGLHLAWTDNPLLNIGLTIFWLVAITNAVNLLDN